MSTGDPQDDEYTQERKHENRGPEYTHKLCSGLDEAPHTGTKYNNKCYA